MIVVDFLINVGCHCACCWPKTVVGQGKEEKKKERKWIAPYDCFILFSKDIYLSSFRDNLL